jgi:hypothetical protein
MGRLEVAVSALGLLIVATAAAAQITTGTVSGSVKDDQGLRIPGATVALISEARGTRLAPVVTNATGDFVVPNVTADTYTLEVVLEGFQTLRRPGVVVSPGDRVSVGELALSVGGTSETVVVTSEAPLLQAQSGERSFTVTTIEVQNLPISNRSFASLTSLTPGVTGTTRLGGGGQNNYMIDGASAMDTGNNGLALALNVDAIAEVKVLSAGYQAEFGRASGLQITAVTKSGTNAYHGSVYDVEQNSDWNSNSWRNRIDGLPKETEESRQWGYTVGGPVGRPGGDNKLFFFYSHEYRPQSTGGNVVRLRVPTLAERLGDFSASLDQNGSAIPALFDATTGAPFAGNVIPGARLYQPGLNILRLWPEPNVQQQPGSSYNFETFNRVLEFNTPQVAVRGDYAPTPSLRFAVKWAGNKTDQRRFSLRDFDDNWLSYPWFKTFTTNVNYTINPTTFVEATYGYANRRLGRVPITAFTNRFDVGLGGLPLIYPDANILPDGSYNKQVMEDLKPPFYVDGRAELPPLFQWGNRIGTPPPSLSYPGFLNTNPVHDISVSVTRLVGRHTVKSGFYVNSSRKAQNLNQRNALPFQGRINFGNDSNNPLDTGFGFANAALGVFSEYTQQANFIEGNFVYRNIEGYVQDNWKVTPRLTVDYGVRLTYQQPQYDRNGQASNFFIDRYDPASAPALYEAGCAGGVNPCSGANRQALNPVTGQLLGPGTTALIGQIVPMSGDLANGIVRAGQAPNNEYNYEWPALAVSPRFGMAVDLLGDQSVVLRGGIGMFVDRPDGDSIYYQSQNPPTSASSTLRYGRLQTLGQGGIASQGVPTLIHYRFDNDSLPSSVQWNGGVQMALPWSSALDVSYVGQHSYDVLNAFQSFTAVNVNAIDFGAAFLPENQDLTLPASGVPGARALHTDLMRPILGYGNIDQQWQGFDRTYHSIQTSLNRRFRSGVSASLNWTLSLKDDGTTGVPVRLQHAADGSWSVRADQAEFNELMKNQGLRRHVVSANFVWDLPDVATGDGARGVLASLVNDWMLSGVFTGGSGEAYDVTYRYQREGNNVNLTGSPHYPARIVINGDLGSGCSSDRFRQFDTSVFSGPLPGSLGLESGRNYLSRCPTRIMDFSIARTIRLGGSRTVQLRAEVFNAFDTVVYSAVNTTLDLVSPTNQTVRNAQFLPDGTVDPTRVRVANAGFGAVTNAQPLRSVQLQARFTF